MSVGDFVIRYEHKFLRNIYTEKEINDSEHIKDLESYYERHQKAILTTDNKVEKIEQRRFQVTNESMQMNSVSKIPFGQLNDERCSFSNGLVSIPYGHPSLEELWKEKHKYRDIHKVIQKKKVEFLLKESKILESIPRLNILAQIFAQRPILQ